MKIMDHNYPSGTYNYRIFLSCMISQASSCTIKAFSLKILAKSTSGTCLITCVILQVTSCLITLVGRISIQGFPFPQSANSKNYPLYIASINVQYSLMAIANLHILSNYLNWRSIQTLCNQENKYTIL